VLPSDDKVEGLRLSSAFDITCRVWKERFKVQYTHCGCPDIPRLDFATLFMNVDSKPEHRCLNAVSALTIWAYKSFANLHNLRLVKLARVLKMATPSFHKDDDYLKYLLLYRDHINPPKLSFAQRWSIHWDWLRSNSNMIISSFPFIFFVFVLPLPKQRHSLISFNWCHVFLNAILDQLLWWDYVQKNSICRRL